MTGDIMIMGGTALPARWESRLAGFGPREPGAIRLHHFAEGSDVSACGNHHRAPMRVIWSAEQEPCPRCAETFAWAGQPVPPMPERPQRDDHADEGEEATP